MRIFSFLCLCVCLSVGLFLPGTCYAERLKIITQSGQEVHLLVEMADTDEERRNGLMNRDSLFPYDGMLFVFEKPEAVKFWMKDTKISLDMIFIGEDGLVKGIKRRARAYGVAPIPAPEPVLAVLELEGGQAKALGISRGAKVIHSIFEKDLK